MKLCCSLTVRSDLLWPEFIVLLDSLFVKGTSGCVGAHWEFRSFQLFGSLLKFGWSRLYMPPAPSRLYVSQ